MALGSVQPQYIKPSKKWVEDDVVLAAKDLSNEEIAESEMQIVRFYVFQHLCSNDQEIEDGVFSLIRQYSSPLIVKYIDARKISHYTVVKQSYGTNDFKYNPDDDSNIKIVIVGRGAIGKTSMCITYTTGYYPTRYIPTVFDNYSQNMMVDGVVMNIGLWDTAGGEDYARLRPLCYKQTNVFLVCMDVCAFKNKSELEKPLCERQIDTLAFVQEAKDYCGHDVPICIVGMKTDLRKDDQFKDKCWSTEEMEDFAKYYCGCNNYIECSSKNNEGLNEVFNFAIRGAIDCKISKREKLKSKDKKNCVIL